MGRPGHKRPRPPPYSYTEEEAEPSALSNEPHFPLFSHPLCNSGNNGLQALVAGTTSGATKKTAAAETEDADEEAGQAAVQHVWGDLSEADIATAPGNVEVDGAGVAWLVNTSLRSSEADTQPSTSDHHGVAAAATSAAAAPETSTQVTLVSTCHRGNDRDQNDIKAAPPLGAAFLACDAALREKLSRAKGEFDEIPVAVFKRVRSACNPAEALGRGSFLNRSAMKLANIDAIVAGQLSLGGSGGSDQEQSAEKQEKAKVVARGGGHSGAGCEPLQAKALPSIQPAAKKALLFADLCGGPGGFSEYLLRRRRQINLPARGWGISLREGDGGGGSSSGIGIRDSTAAQNSSRDDAVVGDHDGGTDNGDGEDHCKCFFSTGEETETAIASENSDSTMTTMERPLIPAVQSTAGPSPDRAVERGLSRHQNDHRDKDGIKKEEDPCAWRLDHLKPWCDVSVSTAGMEPPGTATTKYWGEGDAPKCSKPAAAIAAAAAVPPLLEMRIDFGPTGTGDVMDMNNMQGFVDTILASTAGRYLDLVIADGGFGAARDALEQETLLSPLLHCEALAALLLLEEGGSFVCKIFECWTGSTAALVYLLHRKFRRIAIVKPITSRPASGERYLVCTGFAAPARSPSRCRFTNALRAKVQALQGMGPRRFDFDPVPVVNPSAKKSSHVIGQRGSGGGGSGDHVAAADGRFDAALLGVEADMEQDGSFMWYLRHSNDLLASMQAKACVRIIDVASTKRGRAWAFRDSNSSSKNSRGGDRGSPSGADAIVEADSRGHVLGGGGRGSSKGGSEINSSAESAERSDHDATALRRFWRAWGLNGL